MRGWNVINSGHVWCPIMFFIIDAKPSVYFCILSENRRILFPKLDLWGDIKKKKKKKILIKFHMGPHRLLNIESLISPIKQKILSNTL